MEEKALTAALIINIIIVIFEVRALTDQYRHDGPKIFTYYTYLSNIFAGIASLIFAVSAIISLGAGTQVPVWIKGLRYLSTVTLGVTFIVVMTILAPTSSGGYKKMLFKHNAVFVHFLCPLLAMLSFMFFEGQPALDFHWTFIALIPTLLYSAVSVICNYMRIWDGPYRFLKVHEQSVGMSFLWGVLILGGAYAAGLGIWYVNSLF